MLINIIGLEGGNNTMKYYEIWFYFYGENDPRTDFENEYTFYIKTREPIQSKEQLIQHLKKEFPITDKEFNARMHYIPEKDYAHLTKWFEIPAEEFHIGTGIPVKLRGEHVEPSGEGQIKGIRDELILLHDKLIKHSLDLIALSNELANYELDKLSGGIQVCRGILFDIISRTEYQLLEEGSYITFIIGADLLRNTLFSKYETTDAVYEKAVELTKEFQDSEYNDTSKDLYSCVAEFLDTKRSVK
jgi:hypothetical protein